MIVENRFLALLGDVRSAVKEAYQRLSDRLSSFVRIESPQVARAVLDPEAEQRRSLTEAVHIGIAALFEGRSRDHTYRDAILVESSALIRWIAVTDVSALPAAGSTRERILKEAIIDATLSSPTAERTQLTQAHRDIVRLNRKDNGREMMR